MSHADLAKKLSELDAQFKDHDEKIEAIFRVIQELIGPDEKVKKKQIGYTVKEKQASYGRKSKGKKGGAEHKKCGWKMVKDQTEIYPVKCITNLTGPHFLINGVMGTHLEAEIPLQRLPRVRDPVPGLRHRHRIRG